jgi:hypothetical protein
MLSLLEARLCGDLPLRMGQRFWRGRIALNRRNPHCCSVHLMAQPELGTETGELAACHSPKL